MKIHTSQFHLRAVGCGILFCLAVAPLMAADATPHPAGAPKVRVMVKENNIASTAGSGRGRHARAPPARRKLRPGNLPAAAAATAP